MNGLRQQPVAVGALDTAGVASPVADRLLEALGEPAIYGRVDRVTKRETHGSWVFLCGPWAYKLKKPVKLAFLDYSTLALRRAACREEVRVNTELAGDIYVAVRAIVPSGGGFAFGPEEAAGAVEYAVQMRRFDDSQTLQASIEAGSVRRHDVRDLARCLVDFHGRASVVRGGALSRVRARWRADLEELEQLVPDRSRQLALARGFGERFLEAHAHEITEREREELFRDGHGDLRCEHVLVSPQIRIVDRIEFDPTLRALDVCCDLAFLAMDLEANGHAADAARLRAEYENAGGRTAGPELSSFYAAGWALVRTKVERLAAAGSHEAGHLARAERLLALAERLIWRARGAVTVMIAGPAASGKSTLAHELARASGLAVVSSDAVRKQLAGVSASARAGSEHYTEDFTRATYRAVGEAARTHLSRGRGVIVDATARNRELRAILLATLRVPRSRILLANCQVSPETALARAEERMRDPARVSDATPEIAARHQREFEAPAELPAKSVLALDCERALADQLGDLTEAVDRRLY